MKQHADLTLVQRGWGGFCLGLAGVLRVFDDPTRGMYSGDIDVRLRHSLVVDDDGDVWVLLENGQMLSAASRVLFNDANRMQTLN